jgi:diaminopimelate epimerase
MVYYNSDGSRASMCGNAGLCVTMLAARLGIGRPGELRFESDAGPVRARVRNDVAEIELEPVRETREDAGIALGPGEERIGFALAGVPHLVVLAKDVEGVDVLARGRTLRRDRSLEAGANVNFLSRRPDGSWSIRTYERGVEGETLACGTGAVAAGLLVHLWGLSEPRARLRSRSGNELGVTLQKSGESWVPTLSGEGRLVFTGELPE